MKLIIQSQQWILLENDFLVTVNYSESGKIALLHDISFKYLTLSEKNSDTNSDGKQVSLLPAFFYTT